MLLYRISGTDTWVDWDVLHNDQGYSKFPCVSMTYKKISPWGTDGGSGYKDSQTTPFYFVSGNHGWLPAVSMPGEIGLYPSEATPLQMINGAVVSNAVTMDFLNGTWYLIEAEIANERYWLTESMVEELGWEVYEEGTYEFVFVDSTTGRVVYGVEQLDEMVFVEESAYPIVSHFHVDFDAVQTLANGAYIDTILPYYASKLYIAGTVNRISKTVVDYGLDVSNEGGYVRVTNNTGASVTLTRLAIQSMDAADAEVVEVVDGQDNHAYSFKWDDGGTPYWWISYSGERHWTDSLGNWSEVPSVVLPTVEKFSDAYPTTSSARGSYAAGDSGYLYEHNPVTRAMPYDNSKVYSVYGYYIDSGWKRGRFFDAQNDGGIVKIVNITSSTISGIYLFLYATCSSNQATVVTVYDSSNNPFNAFKYTVSGTDYYYVLDGTQTDWTDDLAGIGYQLPQVGYFTSSGSSASSNTSLSSSYWNYVYDASGAEIPYDSSKTYTSLRAITASGTVIDTTSGYMGSMRNSQAVYVLAFKPVSSISAIRVEYAVS